MCKVAALEQGVVPESPAEEDLWKELELATAIHGHITKTLLESMF